MLRPLALLWLAGICLRITVLAIPPVIPQIHDSFALSQAAIGALTSLPVLLFSFAAIPGSLLVSRLGPVAVLLGGIFLTGIAGALRGGAPDASALFITTFLMGVGIAIMQPALPAVVRDWVPRKIALGTATYANALLVGEAISASLTIPVVLPVMTALGFDPIWFGVIIVMTVELGLIHPPVGMNVFVIKSVIKDLSFATIFKGVIPFILTDLIRLVILIAFPILALWLPSQMQ